MDYLEPAAQFQLLTKLKESTLSGKLKWQKLTDDDYSFHSAGRQFGYVIASKDKDDFAPFSLEIFGPKEIRELSSGDTPPFSLLQSIESGNIGSINNVLADIFILAKRQTFNFDSIASKILNDFE